MYQLYLYAKEEKATSPSLSLVKTLSPNLITNHGGENGDARPFELCALLTLPERHLSRVGHERCNSLGHFKGDVCWQAPLSYGVNKGKSIDVPPQQSDVDVAR